MVSRAIYHVVRPVYQALLIQSRLSSLAVLALGSLLALGAPTPDNIALARKYAPQWKFQTSEIYWPSTVEYFLAGVKVGYMLPLLVRHATLKLYQS